MQGVFLATMMNKAISVPQLMTAITQMRAILNYIGTSPLIKLCRFLVYHYLDHIQRIYAVVSMSKPNRQLIASPNFVYYKSEQAQQNSSNAFACFWHQSNSECPARGHFNFRPFYLVRGKMLQLKRFKKSTAIFAVLILLAVSIFADTIRLKDGSIIKGKIISFAGGSFTVKIGDREMTFNSAEVESIQFDSPMTSQVRTSGIDQPPVIIGSTAKPTPQPTPETIEIATEPVSTDVPKENIYTPEPRSNRKPISLNVKVLADNTSNGWTNSGWIVRKGQQIHIKGTGEVSLGGGKTSPAAGLSDAEDPQKLMQSVPTGALIAVVGDDNNDFIYVGMERTFTATRDGALFLGVNDGNLDDNTGAFDVTIEIDPDSGN